MTVLPYQWDTTPGIANCITIPESLSSGRIRFVDVRQGLDLVGLLTLEVIPRSS